MDELEHKYGFTLDDWETCLKVLKAVKDNPLENPDNHRFIAFAADRELK